MDERSAGLQKEIGQKRLDTHLSPNERGRSYLGVAAPMIGISMNSRASKSLVSILLFALLATAPGPATAANPLDAELVLPSETCRGLFIVPVTFGEGTGTTLDFLLDTGSSWTFLDPGALRGIAGGDGRAGKASFQGVRIGPLELGRLRASVLPMRDLCLAVGREFDGILGFPAFRNVLLTLDYPAEEIRVSSGSLPRPDGREIFRVHGKRPHLKVAIGNRRIKLLVDSGSTSHFQLKASDRLTWSVEPRPATCLVGVGGLVVREGGRLDGAVRFGPLDFENPVVILGGSEGQVGWHVLRHFVLTFDQKNKRMRMQADRTDPVRMAPLVGTGLAYDPRPEGLRVVRVFSDTSAEAAGLREGDLIVAIDGIPVHSRGCVSRSDVGQQQVFLYLRDGIRTEATVETEALVP